MSAPVKKCEVCDDTGSRHSSKFLDCTQCGAAVERSEFDSKIYSGEKMSIDDRLWLAYQLGKAAGPDSGSDAALAVSLLKNPQLLRLVKNMDEANHVDDFGKRARKAFEELCEWIADFAAHHPHVAAAPVVPVAAQPVVPDGWKLVPEKPTPKMVDATWGDDMAGMSHNKMNKHIYAAMLAAAPSLEAQPAGEVERDAALKFSDHIINGAFDGGDWCGGDIQELAVEYGLLKPETMNSACSNDGGCQCVRNGEGFPSTCYRKTYIAAMAQGEKP